MRSAPQYQDVIARLFPEYAKEDLSGLTRSITFCVTNACQLRCTYCYEHNKGGDRMSFETAKKFVDLLLREEKGMGLYANKELTPAVVLDFIGGEPLLEIDLIERIVDYFQEQCFLMGHPWGERFMVSICSNGVAYRDPRVQRFLERHKNVLSFSVTLDGTREMHDACRVFAGTGEGSYDLAYDAATDWMSRGNYMGSKVTIAPGNVDRLYEAFCHMLAAGYRDIHANCVYEEGWTTGHAAELYRQLKMVGRKIIADGVSMEDLYFAMFDEGLFVPMDAADNDNWCGGTGLMIACDWNGNILPCIRYMDMSLAGKRPPLVIGNVDDGILRTPECATCWERLGRITRRSQSTDECFFCPIAKGCAWCSAYNYEVFGTADKRATFICPMHKARALANAWFWPRYWKASGEGGEYVLHVPDEWALEIIGAEELAEIKSMCTAPA